MKIKVKNSIKTDIAVIIISLLISTYLGIFLAPCIDKERLSATIVNLNNAIKHPFSLSIVPETFKTILVMYLIDVCVFMYVYSNRKNRRRGEEHGSAKILSPKNVNKEISDSDFSKNRILSDGLKISVTGKKTNLSLNTMVIGGMAAGKSFFTLIPNLMQCNTSFVVTDPSKELLKATGGILKEKGYKVRWLDVEEPEHSFKYNFFNYIKNEDDMRRIVDIIFSSTADSSKSVAEPMWENMASDYLLSLIALLHYRGNADEKNIDTLIWLMDEDFLRDDENGNRIETPVSIMFDELELEMPGNFASSAYRSAVDGDTVTIRGVKSTLRGRMGRFLLPSIRNLMERDELELYKIGQEKTALFLCVPSEDKSFNFIVSMVYAQLLPILYKTARSQHDNKLPVPIQFFLDEMANFVMPKDFVTYLTTARKHGISFVMFYQEKQQIDKQFEKEFNTLIGTCNTFLYLGGSGKETNKYISEWIGTETVVSESYSRQYGFRGHVSKSENIVKRELLTPDEIDTKIDYEHCIVYVRGHGFIYDLKYNPKNHPLFNSLNSKIDITGDDIVACKNEKINNVSDVDRVDLTIDLRNLNSFILEENLDIRISEE